MVDVKSLHLDSSRERPQVELQRLAAQVRSDEEVLAVVEQVHGVHVERIR
jgi:hypothetical protein